MEYNVQVTGGSISTLTWFNNFSPPAPRLFRTSPKHTETEKDKVATGQYILSDKLKIFAYRLQYYLRIEETCEQFYTLLFFLCGFFFRRRERFQVQQLRHQGLSLGRTKLLFIGNGLPFSQFDVLQGWQYLLSYISYIGEKISYNPLYEPQKPQNLYFVTPFDNDNNNGLKRAKKQ